MKRIIGLIAVIMLVAVSAQAQCVAEVKDVIQDEVRGSIIVQTEYVLNGVVVQQGQTRYLETSGTNEEIIAKVNDDIAIHCENLVRRIPENAAYLRAQKLAEQKKLTQPVIDAIKPVLVGVKATKIEAKDIFKDKEYTVKADKTTSVKDVVVAVEPIIIAK